MEIHSNTNQRGQSTKQKYGINYNEDKTTITVFLKTEKKYSNYLQEVKDLKRRRILMK